MSYRVNLTYFKPDGKYYSDSHYESTAEHMYDIFDDVKDAADKRKLPGLIEWHDLMFVLIDVPDHPNNHPHLVIPNGVSTSYLQLD